MKSPSEIAKEIIKSATIHDSDEEKLHFVITESLITQALTAERQRQERLVEALEKIRDYSGDFGTGDLQFIAQQVLKEVK